MITCHQGLSRFIQDALLRIIIGDIALQHNILCIAPDMDAVLLPGIAHGDVFVNRTDAG